MSKAITFSQQFPAYHPRKGQPTYFPLKIWMWVLQQQECPYRNVIEMVEYLNGGKYDMGQLQEFVLSCASPEEVEIKSHTIRRGKRWKAGDKFSPRVWSGKPYQSHQIIIAPDIEIKRVVDFEMDINGVYSLDKFYIDDTIEWQLAKNDGLTDMDMFYWLMPNYQKPIEFIGQILIWNDNNLPY